MVSIIVGIIFILGLVFMALSPSVAGFVLLALLGIISIFIGIADIKDKRDAKKEEEAMRLEEENKQ